MSSSPELSIVIPAYNEERRLPQTLGRIQAYFAGAGTEVEIIVVDDGSSDRTGQVAAEGSRAGGRVRVLRNRINRGKGASIRRGVAAARGARILFTDADLSTPISEFPKLQAALPRGQGIAIGSRAVPGARVLTPQPWYRTVIGKSFNLLVQVVLLPGLWDTQCGFKLFTRSAARYLFASLTIPRFGFDAELLYLARRVRVPVVEVPVEWRHAPDSKVSPVRDSAKMFFDLFRILWRHRQPKAFIPAPAAANRSDRAGRPRTIK